jgi:iron complex transport system substrate-binding protein
VKIVSFLPSATEMVYALGLGDQLVGRSHECNYPPAALAKPVVSHPALPVETMTPQEIDRAVSERLHDGESLYRMDLSQLEALAPDLILTQNLCEVCAPSGNEATQVLNAISHKPRVLYMTPSSLDGVRQNVLELGEAAGASGRAVRLVAEMDERLDRIRARVSAIAERPRVFCMEWLDPIYNAGHWMSEMVEIAGGVDALAQPHKYSVRIPWDSVQAWAPEVLVLAPCGFNASQAAGQLDLVRGLPGWQDLPAVRRSAVYAVDASSYFARPGPRLVDGTELLAHLIHPGAFAWNGPADAFIPIAR